MTDKELINECIKKMPWAWNILYSRFRLLVCSIIRKTAKKYDIYLLDEDFHDCVQHVWESFLAKDCYILRMWKGTGSLPNYLTVCIANAVTTFLIKQEKTESFEVPYDDLPSNLLNSLEEMQSDLGLNIDKKKLIEIIEYIISHKLKRHEYEFAKLFWYEELQYQIISEIMDIPAKKLYLLKHRIEKRIRRLVKKSFSVV